MKALNKYIQILFILFFALSCKDEPNTSKDDDKNNGNNKPAYTQYGIPFDKIPANEDILMYELNLRAFSATGNLQGVTDRLDELKELGINVIWLMPIHPIGEINSVNSPYSVKDYKTVSTEYGSLEDLRNLTDEAHQRDIAVIMDWVANHTSWDNDWIYNIGWHTEDASGNVIHPPGTNWLDVADLNYNNENMRAAMINAMKYWLLEANVDGYRCDYADGVPFDFWKQALDTLTSIHRQFIFLAEGSRNDHFSAGFDLNYGWDFYNKLKNIFNGEIASGIFTTHNSEYSNIPDGKHKLRFTTNHDESAWDNTPMVLFNGEEGALAASVITIFLGGVPLLYTGQEVGTVEKVPFFSNSPINWDEKLDMLQAYKELLSVYSQSEVARIGSNSNYPDTNVVCFNKELNTYEMLIIVNVRNDTIEYKLPGDLQNTNWNDVFTGNIVALDTLIQLINYQYMILEN